MTTAEKAQETVEVARAEYNRTNRIAALREREIDAFIKAATTSLRNSVAPDYEQELGGIQSIADRI